MKIHSFSRRNAGKVVLLTRLNRLSYLTLKELNLNRLNPLKSNLRGNDFHHHSQHFRSSNNTRKIVIRQLTQSIILFQRVAHATCPLSHHKHAPHQRNTSTVQHRTRSATQLFTSQRDSSHFVPSQQKKARRCPRDNDLTRERLSNVSDQRNLKMARQSAWK